MPNRIKNSKSMPGATGLGTWFNATALDLVAITAGISLLKQSTALSMIDSDMVLADVQTNILARRTALWNCVDLLAPTLQMTVVFHAADGPTSARFFVCAGIDSNLGTANAVTLWQAAVKQFAGNNSVTTDAFYTWTQTGVAYQLNGGDLINPVMSSLLTGGIIQAASPEIYPLASNKRWPVNLTTSRFIAF